MNVVSIHPGTNDAGEPVSQHTQHRHPLDSIKPFEELWEVFGIEKVIEEDDVVVPMTCQRHRSRYRSSARFRQRQVVPLEPRPPPTEKATTARRQISLLVNLCDESRSCRGRWNPQHHPLRFRLEDLDAGKLQQSLLVSWHSIEPADPPRMRLFIADEW